ncbi:hypothetical protein J3459_018466 [Metarhizium acridum]|nr:hypothetical protein J3459_018466 [Metarhizium acridum]
MTKLASGLAWFPMKRHESTRVVISPTAAYSSRKRSDTGERCRATPPPRTGCNASSSRRYALSDDLCVENVVSVSEPDERDEGWLRHAGDGFKIRLSRQVMPWAPATA